MNDRLTKPTHVVVDRNEAYNFKEKVATSDIFIDCVITKQNVIRVRQSRTYDVL